MELPGIAKATALTLRPGDILAVQLGRAPTGEECASIMERLAEIAPEGVRVIITDPDVSIEARPPGPGDS